MSTRQPFTTHHYLFLAIVAASGISPALAQVQPQKAAPVLEEVIVTAQKREQNVQDIPVSVTAINTQMIEQAGIHTTEDMVRVAPSLTFTGNLDKNVQAFSVRGIGTNTFGINVEQSVAFIIDDVATAQQGESVENLSDIERIEVLRGPQSTLFGKSASAGAILITTKGPSEEFEGSINATLTDDDEQRLAGSVSGPMSDAWGYRLSGYWSDRDGYIDNLYNSDKLNGSENYGMRGKLRWDVSDSVEAMLTAYYNKDEDSCCQLTLREISPDARLFGAFPLDFTGISVGDDNDNIRADINAKGDTETKGGNLRFNVALADYTLMSITAYNNWQYDTVTDVDGWDVNIAAAVGSGNGGMYQVAGTENDFFSQEFRLISPGNDQYEYLIGLYYADSDTDRNAERNIDPALPFAQVLADSSAGTTTTALYGQLTWNFTSSTSVTAGLRYGYEEIYGKYHDLLAGTDAVKGNDDDSDTVGKIALQHFLDEDTMLFVSYATGYKGQAFDVTEGFDEEKAKNPVQPETSESIELGMKGRFWDRRLQLNATLYWAKYDDFQAQSTVVRDFGIADFNLVNVGKLETSGAEIESTALLTQSLTLTANAAYMDAEINDYTGANCWPGQTLEQGCQGNYQDIDGGDLPSAPQWKFSVFLDYEHELVSMPFDAFAGVNYSWQDDVTFDINQDPNLYQDAYGIANLRLGITDKASRYKVTAFVNNLFDEQYTSGMRNGSQLYDGENAFSQMLPRNAFRYWGVLGTYNF
jgi:iron complex outermembrane recepter protein